MSKTKHNMKAQSISPTVSSSCDSCIDSNQITANKIRQLSQTLHLIISEASGILQDDARVRKSKKSKLLGRVFSRNRSNITYTESYNDNGETTCFGTGINFKQSSAAIFARGRKSQNHNWSSKTKKLILQKAHKENNEVITSVVSFLHNLKAYEKDMDIVCKLLK